MTTFNTGNPIGSTDARDRLDNTENMDYLENSTTELTHPDRLGTVRKTRHGMEAEHDAQISAHESEHDAQMQAFESDFDGRLAGMAFTRVGSFTTGATLTDMRQVLVWEVSQGGDGHEYGWSGSFPKVVSAGSTPATSGGIGVGAWVDRTDLTFRSDLASESGSGLVGYQPAGNGAVATTMQSKLREFVSVRDFGAVGDGVTDDTNAILSAISSGNSVLWPPGTYKISKTIQSTTPQSWVALGKVIIKYAAPAGSAITPALDFLASIQMQGDFTVDHGANTGNYLPPAVYGGNPIAGSAVLVQGDYSKVIGIQVQNAWDNGISAVKIDTNTNVAVAGSPHYGIFSDINTYNCGVGTHTGSTPGKIGAGIDVASASAWQVANCNDYYSYVGFIEDIGAGAQCQWANCTSWWPQWDTSNPANGSGYGFYAGSADSQYVNCTVVGSAYRSWWIDQPAINCNFTNCYSENPYDVAFWIKAEQVTLMNCRSKGASQRGAGVADAFWIDSSAGNIVETMLIGCSTTGSLHRYGLNANGSGGCKVGLIGESFNGTAGVLTSTAGSVIGNLTWNNISGNQFGVNRVAPGFEFDVYGRMRTSADRANSSYLTTPFGDTASNGTFFIEDYATPSKRIAMGWDPINNVAVMQAIQAGVSKMPMMINPSGGDVCAGASGMTTTSTNGFLQIPAIAGAPVGAPGLQSGFAAICFDTTNNKIWVRTGSVWKSVTVS